MPARPADCSPDQVEATIADSAATERLPARRLLGKRALEVRRAPEGAGVAEEDGAWISVGALLDLIAAELAARRPVATWWERAAGVDYVRHGRAYVRAGFGRSYGVAQQVLDEWSGGWEQADLELLLDDAADALMELIVQEERALFKEGGPVFPYRERGGSRFEEEERSFDQLTREARQLHACIQRVDAAAAAAAAAAEEALQTMGRGHTAEPSEVEAVWAPDNGADPPASNGAAAEPLRRQPSESLDKPVRRRSVSPEGHIGPLSFRHRCDLVPPQS